MRVIVVEHLPSYLNDLLHHLHLGIMMPKLPVECFVVGQLLFTGVLRACVT